MPDVADPGYWSRNLTAETAHSLAADAGGTRGIDNGWRANPTLGPDAAAFLQRAAAAAQAARRPSFGPAAAAAVAGRATLSNPPFWYSFSHGSVHFVVVSTEHDLGPESRQHRVSSWLVPAAPLSQHRSARPAWQAARDARYGGGPVDGVQRAPGSLTGREGGSGKWRRGPAAACCGRALCSPGRPRSAERTHIRQFRDFGSELRRAPRCARCRCPAVAGA